MPNIKMGNLFAPRPSYAIKGRDEKYAHDLDIHIATYFEKYLKESQCNCQK